jgi:hypothetical protein
MKTAIDKSIVATGVGTQAAGGDITNITNHIHLNKPGQPILKTRRTPTSRYNATSGTHTTTRHPNPAPTAKAPASTECPPPAASVPLNTDTFESLGLPLAFPCGFDQEMHDKKMINDEVSASPMMDKIKTAKAAHRFGPCLIQLTVDEIIKAFVCGLLVHLEDNREDNKKFGMAHVKEIAEKLRAGSLNQMIFAIDGKRLRIYDGNHRVAALMWLESHGLLDECDRFVPVSVRISSKAVAEAQKHSCDHAKEPSNGAFACNSSYMLAAMKNNFLNRAQVKFGMNTPTVSKFKKDHNKSQILTRIINFMLTEKANMSFMTLFASRHNHAKNLHTPACSANDQMPEKQAKVMLAAFGKYLSVLDGVKALDSRLYDTALSKVPFLSLYMAETIGKGTPVGKHGVTLKSVFPSRVAYNIKTHYKEFDSLTIELSRSKVCAATVEKLLGLVCG